MFMENSRTDDWGGIARRPGHTPQSSSPDRAKRACERPASTARSGRRERRVDWADSKPARRFSALARKDRPERLAGARAYQLHRVSIRGRDDCGGLLMLGRKREEPVEMLADQLDRHPERQVAQSE